MKNLGLFVCGLLSFFLGACVGSSKPRNPMKAKVEVAPVKSASVAAVITSVPKIRSIRWSGFTGAERKLYQGFVDELIQRELKYLRRLLQEKKKEKPLYDSSRSI